MTNLTDKLLQEWPPPPIFTKRNKAEVLKIKFNPLNWQAILSIIMHFHDDFSRYIISKTPDNPTPNLSIKWHNQ